MNLAYKYPIAYWNCAVLSCNSGAMEEEGSDKKASTQYGKIAKAIGELQYQGIKVCNPDINKSKFRFSVDIDNYNIFYGLKGVSKINDDDIKHIIKNRPYKNLEDFYNKSQHFLNRSKIVSLIKGGCFDIIENSNRTSTMEKFIYLTSGSELKTKLTLANLRPLLESNLVPQDYKLETRIYKFKKHILQSDAVAQETSKKWVVLEPKFALPFFEEHYVEHMNPNKDYKIDNNGNVIVSDTALDRVTSKLLTPLTEWLNTDEALEMANTLVYLNNWEKYVKHNNIEKWEMESISFYSNNHELDSVDLDAYGVCNYFDLPTEPTFEYLNGRKIIDIFTIAGTVVDKNKGKHTISLLTPNGIVTVKFSKGAFNHYNKQLSAIDKKTNKKTIVDPSWFNRGNLLILKGFRQDDRFIARNYSGHTVMKIVGTRDKNLLWLQTDRHVTGN